MQRHLDLLAKKCCCSFGISGCICLKPSIDTSRHNLWWIFFSVCFVSVAINRAHRVPINEKWSIYFSNVKLIDNHSLFNWNIKYILCNAIFNNKSIFFALDNINLYRKKYFFFNFQRNQSEHIIHKCSKRDWKQQMIEMEKRDCVARILLYKKYVHILCYIYVGTSGVVIFWFNIVAMVLLGIYYIVRCANDRAISSSFIQ